MPYRNKKNRSTRALTLVEMVIAMAIMVIVFAVLLPQFTAIHNSWDTKAGAAEALQNGRILIDHLNQNLSGAVRIAAVSDPSQTNGYIEFIDNDANNVRYDINADNYVEFGPVGNLSLLAGPVGKLQFTCYDAYDLDTPITDVNAVRSVKVETTLTNPAELDQSIAFSTQAYIRTNALTAMSGRISKIAEPWLEFDTVQAMETALCPIDQNHYLCTYRGDGDEGWAAVLTVDTGTWNVNKESAFRYDSVQAVTPALAGIDDSHYLCAYCGQDNDGWVRILKVNTVNWAISEKAHFEFDQNLGKTPALVQIDQAHYLCAYTGPGDDGWAVVITVAEPLFDAITMQTPFEFDNQQGIAPALSKIDDTHYLCAYTGPGDDGWAVVLTVNTANWSVGKELPFEYDSQQASTPALAQIDNAHYLCAYSGNADVGWATVLKVNTGTWQITNQTPFEFDTVGITPGLLRVDSLNCLCAYMGPYSDGWSVILTVDTAGWNISEETPFEFDPAYAAAPALAKIDDNHFLCTYTDSASGGLAGVLELGDVIRP
jgi:type II secretory pathway pseudopilin PulG